MAVEVAPRRDEPLELPGREPGDQRVETASHAANYACIESGAWFPS
jgi:hypothetical protein